MLLLAAGALAAAFAVVQLADPDTQLLGLTLGLAAAAAAGALGVAGRLMVAQETRVEPRPLPEPAGAGRGRGRPGSRRRRGHLPWPPARDRRRRRRGLGGGGRARTARLPGPLRRGHRHIALEGRYPPGGRVRRPDRRRGVELGTFTTAFPEGADPRELGSPVVLLCGFRPATFTTAPGGRPTGCVAYSKICTHAGCAVAMLRYGRFGAHVPRPALVCPCHYSTFDPARRRARAVRTGRACAAPAAAAADRRRRRGGRRCDVRADRPVLVERPPRDRARAEGGRRAAPAAPRCGSRCATCSPTTGRSCGARSPSTASSCWSRPAST